jgi:hypothetical protein
LAFILPLIFPLIITLLEGLVPEMASQAMHVIPTTAIFYVYRTSFATPVNIRLLVVRLAWTGLCTVASLWVISRIMDRQAQIMAGEHSLLERQGQPSGKQH